MERVFILGAGFSVHAGFPLVRSLREKVVDFICQNPDPSYDVHLHPWAHFQKGQFWEGLEAADATGTLEFEELLIRLTQIAKANSWHPAGLSEKLLRHACSKLLWRLHGDLKALPGPYLQFAQQLNAKDVIVSFNWDILAEKACQEALRPWSYEPGCVLQVIKPHGSITWSNHRQQNCTAIYHCWRPIIRGTYIDYYDAIFEDPFPNGVNEDLRYALFPGDPDDPNDSELTENDKRKQDRALLWDQVEQAIEATNKVIFIGYSLPEYDSYAKHFFRAACTGKNVEVWNPSEKDCVKFKSTFGDSTICYPVKFEESKYAKSYL
jgi:hypothetical protein